VSPWVSPKRLFIESYKYDAARPSSCSRADQAEVRRGVGRPIKVDVAYLKTPLRCVVMSPRREKKGGGRGAGNIVLDKKRAGGRA